MKQAYWNALRYASLLDQDNYKDITHDAYINYYKSKQKNLFLEPKYVIGKVIKYTTFDFWKKRSWRYKNKELEGVRVFVEFNDGNESDMSAHKANYTTPFHELIAKELVDRYNNLCKYSRLKSDRTNVIKDILDLRLQGLGNKDIAKQLDINLSLVNYYISNVNFKSIK